jgi:hypothetical protein
LREVNVFFFLSISHHMKDAYLTMSKEIVPISRLEGDVVQNF